MIPANEEMRERKTKNVEKKDVQLTLEEKNIMIWEEITAYEEQHFFLPYSFNFHRKKNYIVSHLKQQTILPKVVSDKHV